MASRRKVNVEPENDWSLQPGSERDAVGGALRKTIRVRLGSVRATCSSWSRNCTQRRRDVSVPRELIDTGNDKRFVRRDSEGQFKESDDVGRSLAQDQKRQSSNKPKKGEGDKGDR